MVNKLHIADPLLGLHVREVGAGGEVADVEETAHDNSKSIRR